MKYYKKLLYLLEKESFNLLLLDACGVLYDGQNYFHNIPATINKLKETYQIRLVTNNSSVPPHIISQRFQNNHINILPEEIISSGAGLYLDKKIHSLIFNKKVYAFGKDLSKFYLEQAKPQKIVHQLDQAETIVFLDTLVFEDHHRKLNEIIKHVKNNPKIPVICCNPDRYILNNNELVPVIGHYVKQVIKKAKIKVHWIGKPYQNFSRIVEESLKKENLLLDERQKIAFFDDNIHNIKRLTKDLKIKGVLIKNTGLAKLTPIEKFTKPEFLADDFVIDNFSF